MISGPCFPYSIKSLQKCSTLSVWSIACSAPTLYKIMNKESRNDLLKALSIFIFAFIPRYVGIGTTIVADEQLWIKRSISFLKSLLELKLQGTSISGHPGVITMWLGSLSIGFTKYVNHYKELSDLLFAAQLPIAITTSLTIVMLYFMIRVVFNEKIAIISAILITLDPFYLAFSRIIHLDALLTSFMALSLLSFLIFIQRANSRKMLVTSGVFAGLALLTKVPAAFLFPFIAMLLLSYFLHTTLASPSSAPKEIKGFSATYIIWSATAFCTIVALWPAMWLDPLVLIRLFTGAPGMVAHEQGQFFMGAPVNDPGLFYYPLVAMFRATPLTMIFFSVCIAFLTFRFVRSFRSCGEFERITLILVGYAFLFTFLMSFGAKKLGRYILPIFPIIDIISAIGIFVVLDWLVKKFGKQAKTNVIFSIVVILVFISQVIPIAKVHPYYLSYYNPLAGGPKKAQEVILIGRGEGMDLVAEYLNRKENPEKITVASEFAYLLRVHFKGKLKSTKIKEYEPNTLNEVDYLVVYISGLQKKNMRIPNEVLQYHNRHEPEQTITINGINYAYIYKL